MKEKFKLPTAFGLGLSIGLPILVSAGVTVGVVGLVSGSTPIAGFGANQLCYANSSGALVCGSATATIDATNGIVSSGLLNTKDTRVTTTDYTNATTGFTAITGLTATVVSARKYRFEAVLFASESVAAEGGKIDFNGGGAAMTSFIVTCQLTNAVGAILTQTAATAVALATPMNIASFTDTNMHQYTCHGGFVPSSNGTFIPRAAQNSHTSGTLTIKVNSTLSVWDVQ